MPQIETLDAIRERLVRESLRSIRWQIRIVGAALIGALVGVGIGHDADGRIEFGVGAAVALAAVALVVLWVTSTRPATGVFLDHWGRPHDLTFDEWPELGRGTPLLREGDEQDAHNGVVGELLGRPMVICHFTYKIVGRTEDSSTAMRRTPSSGSTRCERPSAGSPCTR